VPYDVEMDKKGHNFGADLDWRGVIVEAQSFQIYEILDE
jgi:hypothetical protein